MIAARKMLKVGFSSKKSLKMRRLHQIPKLQIGNETLIIDKFDPKMKKASKSRDTMLLFLEFSKFFISVSCHPQYEFFTDGFDQ